MERVGRNENLYLTGFVVLLSRPLEAFGPLGLGEDFTSLTVQASLLPDGLGEVDRLFWGEGLIGENPNVPPFLS